MKAKAILSFKMVKQELVALFVKEFWSFFAHILMKLSKVFDRRCRNQFCYCKIICENGPFTVSFLLYFSSFQNS